MKLQLPIIIEINFIDQKLFNTRVCYIFSPVSILISCFLHVCFFALLCALDITLCHVAYWDLITTSDWETANALCKDY